MSRKRAQFANHQFRKLLPDTVSYPAVLQRCLKDNTLPVGASAGELGVLDKTLIGFFCSVRSPGDAIIKTYDLARALRNNADVAIVGGFQSPMEKECLDLLLRGSAPVVVCPARGLGRMRVRAEWKKPLGEGRLLLLSFFDDGIRRATAELAAKRNEYVAALADSILIAHAGKGSKTEGLCRDALASGKPVFTLDSPDNAHLVALGAVPVQADNPRALKKLTDASER